MSEQATWSHPKRKTKLAGTWEYDWAGGFFIIWLDSIDPITGDQRRVITYNDHPEWGHWKLGKALS